MALHWRLLNANAIYSAKLQCRLCSSALDNVRISKPVLPASTDNLTENASLPKETEGIHLPAPLHGLLQGGMRLVDSFCGSNSQHELLRAQVHDLQSQIANLAVVPYMFADTSLMDPHISHSQQSCKGILSEPKFPKSERPVDEIIAQLLETRCVQHYTYNADDIIIHQSDPSVDSSQLPLHRQLQWDGALLDKHFGVSSGPDLLKASSSSCDIYNIDKPVSVIEPECKSVSTIEEDRIADFSERTESREPSLMNSHQQQVSHGYDDVFDRYDDQELSTDFPAFHLHIITPQFTGATELSTPYSPAPLTSSSSTLLTDSLNSDHMVLMSTDGEEQRQISNSEEQRQQRPNLDQLMRLQDHLADEIPQILKKITDYRIYRADVVFENNYSNPYVTKGVGAYAVEILKLRMWAHFKFANVKLQVLKITTHEDEGTVRAHWRLSGIPQTRAFMFWKFLPGMYRRSKASESDWYEGISTFSVDGSGFVFKHTIDRVIGDKEPELAKKMKLRHRLEAMLTPKPAMGGAACK